MRYLTDQAPTASRISDPTNQHLSNSDTQTGVWRTIQRRKRVVMFYIVEIRNAVGIRLEHFQFQ